MMYTIKRVICAVLLCMVPVARSEPGASSGFGGSGGGFGGGGNGGGFSGSYGPPQSQGYSGGGGGGGGGGHGFSGGSSQGYSSGGGGGGGGGGYSGGGGGSQSYGAPSGGGSGYGQPRHQEPSYPPQPYQFKYDVNDHYSGANFGQKESSDGNRVNGEYRVQLPDGRLQIVRYNADWQNGFNADVQYQGEAKYPEPSKGGYGGGGGQQQSGYGAPSGGSGYGAPSGGSGGYGKK